MIPLHEKYRPRRLQDVIGQDKAVTVLSRFDNDYGGRGFYFTGKSGTGKSTLALIIAESVAGCREGITETTGRELTLTTLRDWYGRVSGAPGLFGGFALVVNESHGLSAPVIEVFLNILESLPRWCVVIFTTTRAGNDLFDDKIDAGPFRSRCLCLALMPQRGQGSYVTDMAQWLHDIATKEGLNGKPVSAYERLLDARHCDGNAREALMFIESGGMMD